MSWGRVYRRKQHVVAPSFRDELRKYIPRSPPSSLDESLLGVGLGRSYGDSCLNSRGTLLQMTRLDRIIAFDARWGILQAEAGLSFADALAFLVPRGFFLPTTPGTRFVTLGGAIANDVHGKNHHKAGAFGCAVTRMSLLRSGGETLILHPSDPLFAATIGGLGLTGIIEWAEIKVTPIASAFLDVEHRAFASLDDFFAIAQAGEGEQWEHSVAWVDCVARGRALGRGIYSRARWREDGDYAIHDATPRLNLPVEAPGWVLNRYSLRIFNELYFARGKRRKNGALHYAPYLFPLDSIANWNRLYGARGMYQYQCVLPAHAARQGIRAMLEHISNAGEGSFLAVLKQFGAYPSPGMLSFARPGITLALDFPNRGAETLRLMANLDTIVAQAGGALYPAKDGRMSATMFRASFERLDEFRKYVDPALHSDFWQRVSA